MRASKSEGPKEIYVKVMQIAPEKANTEFSFTKLKKEYDREGKELKNWNLFSGGGIGASIGLIACFASTVVGVPISSVEVLLIVGSSLLFGIIAGFILY